MQRMWRLTAGNQRGSIFISGLVLVAVMTLLGIALFDLARIEGALAIGDAASGQALYCAEAALGRTMLDTAAGGRIDQIQIAASTTPGVPPPASPWTDTVTTSSGTCTTTVTFTDDLVSARRLLTEADNWRSATVHLPRPLVAVLVGGNNRYYRMDAVWARQFAAQLAAMARAKGCGEGRIMWGHVLRNAMIPILTHTVLAIPFLFTGALLLESFFGIPGLGAITVDAIQGNDFSTLRTIVYIGSLLFIGGQVLTDVSYSLADPRVRLG